MVVVVVCVCVLKVRLKTYLKGVAHRLECFPKMCEVLSSTPSPSKQGRKKLIYINFLLLYKRLQQLS
jgi:hypothetical protein